MEDELDFISHAICANCKNLVYTEENQRFCELRREVLKEDKHCSLFDLDEKKFLNQIRKDNIDPSVEIFQVKQEIKDIYSEKYPDINKATETITKYVTKHFRVRGIRDDNTDELWIYREGIFLPEGMSYVKEITRMIMGKRYTDGFAKKVIDKLATDNFIKKEDFFKIENPYELLTANGILNIKTKELISFNPDKIFFSRLNIGYEPTARIKVIQEFFDNVLKKEDQEIVQELFGYFLLKDYPIHKAVVFLGEGSNGKSVMLSLIKEFLGPENCSNVSMEDLENKTFNVSELFTKHVNVVGELSKKTLEDTERFKEITGNDRIAANRKFKTPIYFKNYAKFVSACNELPKSKDLSEGFWRRWIIINFNKKFVPVNEYIKLSHEEKAKVFIADPHLLDKLTDQFEMEGLLNWSLEGFERFLLHDGFSYNKSAMEIKEAWNRQSSSFASFCMDMIDTSSDGFIPKSDLNEAYSKYCAEKNLNLENSKSIYNHVTTLGGWDERVYVRDTTSERNHDRVMIWKGIKFKSVNSLSVVFDTSQGCYFYVK